jgi:hypothetical protein
MGDKIIIDLRTFFTDNAKLSERPGYTQKAIEMAGEGNDIILTGQAPIWLYLDIAHALHGKAKKLIYRSPVTEDMIIFDHNPI